MIPTHKTIRSKLMNGTSVPICPNVGCGEELKWIGGELLCPFCDV